jgi:CBS domain-containing protein
MRYTTVRDVMTTDVVTLTEATPYKEIVRRLADRHISGASVIDDDGMPVGVVSETDLLAKEADPAAATEHPLLESPRRRANRRKAAADRAGALMTAPPVTIDADATVADAARRMQRHRVNRLPVVDGDGRLIGIVSRGDVLKTFLTPDETIRRRVLDDVLHHDLWLDPDRFAVAVDDGVVTISGHVEQEFTAHIMRQAISAVDGVVRVDTDLTWAISERELRRHLSTPLRW